MKKGTMTPDGKGGYLIEINEGGGNKSFTEILIKLGLSALYGGATWLGSYAVAKIIKKDEKE